MPGLAQFLRRFRFTGVPGAPAVAGVPGDRAAALEVELAPVFALLDAAQRQADEIEAAGEHEVERRHTAAASEAERIVVGARDRLAAERAAATAASLERSARERAALLGEARTEASRIAAAAAERAPALVRLLADEVLGFGPEPP